MSEKPAMPQPDRETNGDVFGHENEDCFSRTAVLAYTSALDAWWLARIEEAVREERERCAQLAESLSCGFHSPWEYSADVPASIRNSGL